MSFNCHLVEYSYITAKFCGYNKTFAVGLTAACLISVHYKPPLSHAHNSTQMILVLKDGNPLSDKTYIHKLQIYWILIDESITGLPQVYDFPAFWVHVCGSEKDVILSMFLIMGPAFFSSWNCNIIQYVKDCFSQNSFPRSICFPRQHFQSFCQQDLLAVKPK